MRRRRHLPRPILFIESNRFGVFQYLVLIVLAVLIAVSQHQIQTWWTTHAHLVRSFGFFVKYPRIAVESWLNDHDIHAFDSYDKLRLHLEDEPTSTSGKFLTKMVSEPIDSLRPMFDVSSALRDPDRRIHDDFRIQPELTDRTQFWFDVYTRYSSKKYIFHHAQYPWIVFSVFDAEPIFQTSQSLMAKRILADRGAKKMRIHLAASLKRLLKNPNSARDRSLAYSLREIPGERKTVYRAALKNLRMQLGQSDFFVRGLRNSEKYLPAMEQEFINADVPIELARIPFVESSFNEDAHSRVGAAGIWQIMSYTAKGKLSVSEKIDERNSPLKATRMAALYLKRDYNYFKSWPLAVTAYNHGIGGVDVAIRKLKTRDLSVIIDRYRSRAFGFASENFYASFLAALHAERYQEEIFGPLLKSDFLDKVYYALPRSMRARSLPRLVGQKVEQFLEYNRDVLKAFETNAKLPKGFRIFVPRDLVEQLDVLLAAPNRISRNG